MKSMRTMNVNRMFDSLKRKPVGGAEDGTAGSRVDPPEVVAEQAIRSFCESSGPTASGEEVLYLPTIVEAAESTPAAAKQCALVIRKYLSKDNAARPYVQYNAIMLIRILADNPGKSFTRNIDAKFVQNVKELFRVGRDPSVKQMLIETLNTFQRERSNDEGLALLLEMWKKEIDKMRTRAGPPPIAPPFNPNSQNYFSRNHHSSSLPGPGELSSRIEEARTSAKLLSQVVQSTPPSEFLYNELVREFSDRCQSASRSIQAYMIAENPAPDNETMETLIETNEQLTKALNQHQRAVLSARKIRGVGTNSPASGTPPPRLDSGFAPPPEGPPPNQSNNSKSARKAVPIPPPGENIPNISDDEEEPSNPFADPENEERTTGIKRNDVPFSGDRPPIATGQFNDTLGVEPYHPGFKDAKSPVSADEEDVAITPQSAGTRRGAGRATTSKTDDSLYRY